MARVYVLEQTSIDDQPNLTEWTLWFQWCRYIYDDERDPEYGYRFIWRRPDGDGGGLQAARGQARIPSVAVLQRLVARAVEAGWGAYDGDRFPSGYAVLRSGVESVLDPKFPAEHRRTQIRAFVHGISFANLSLYDFAAVVGRVPIGGAYNRGDVFKNAGELYNGLDDDERESLRTYFLRLAESVEQDYPDLVQEFPKQFGR